MHTYSLLVTRLGSKSVPGRPRQPPKAEPDRLCAGCDFGKQFRGMGVGEREGSTVQGQVLEQGIAGDSPSSCVDRAQNRSQRNGAERVSQVPANLCPWMLPSEPLPCIPQARNGPASGWGGGLKSSRESKRLSALRREPITAPHSWLLLQQLDEKVAGCVRP